MDRREFLKWSSFLTVSVASSTLLTACGGDDDTAPPTDGGGNDGGGDAGGPDLGFSLGVASGDPRPDSVILWTRVDGAGGDPVKVGVQVATDDQFKSLVVDTTVDAIVDWDYTVRHKVTGLQPATVYYYRFVAGSAASAAGRTKTAPAADADISQLKFAFVSCQDWNANHWAAFSELQKEELDFVVHLGDYIYESIGAPNADDPRHTPIALPDGTERDDGSVYATSLADYRTLYKTYRSDPRLQSLHASAPLIAIWDDHEFSDDAWQGHQTYDADDSAHMTARRRNANQAWFEFMPADVELHPENPAFDSIRIYRSFVFGKLATLVMTDERLYRADHVIPEIAAGGMAGSRYLVNETLLAQAEQAKMNAAGGALTPVSMLGDTQRGWWREQMQGATTTWKLWGNEVSLLRMQVDGLDAVARLLFAGLVAGNPALAPMQDALLTQIKLDLADIQTGGLPGTFGHLTGALGLTGGDAEALAAQLNAGVQQVPPTMLGTVLFDADQWDGYNAERKNLMAFLKAQGIQNVVALTGDIHAFFAGAVMDDFDAGEPQPVMVDLVTAGISSTSLFSYYKSFVDATASLAPLASLVYDGDDNRLDGTMTGYNPWLRHADTDAQGYAVVTLTPAALNCVFTRMKKSQDGQVPSPAVDGTTQLVVRAGTPEVEKTPG
ncbi:alkaline phosphatase D family protein [Pigmentiphaga soli]|uniref:Alkaline phosphatase D family protein n=1 Tax=Pigmentiphaga soli TaxID=1007095 RepID=A0ABP8H0M9_9BURK